MAEPKKVFDVAKPGTSAPSESSRPVIVKRHQMAQDPMMSSGKVTTAPEVEKKEQSIPISIAGKTIQPLSKASAKDESTEDAAPKPDTEKPQKEPITKETTPVVATETPEDSPVFDLPKEEAPADVEPKGQITPQAATSQETPQDSKARVDKENQASLKAQLEHDADVARLIEEKKYFVKISATSRKRSLRRFLVIMILIVLLGVITTELLIDAGIIKTSIAPVVDLIPN